MPSDPSRTETLTAEQAEMALRCVVRELRAAGHLVGCRILSKGGACDCALCLIDLIADRNQPETINLRAELTRLQDAHRAQEERIKKLEQMVAGLERGEAATAIEALRKLLLLTDAPRAKETT